MQRIWALPLLSWALLTLQASAAQQRPFSVFLDPDEPVASPIPEWDLLHAERPPKTSSDHLVFDSVASLLQRWPNTRYRNGHILAPGTIPAGTVFHHGGLAPTMPTTPDWVATDPEHSYIFTNMPWCNRENPGRGPRNGPPPGGGPLPDEDGDPISDPSWNSTCWQLSMVTHRPLKVLHFDGSSAAKLPRHGSSLGGGPLDTQDLLTWGEVHEEKVFEEFERIIDLCAKWGPNGTEVGEGEGFDGFVRMEMNFEVMICDFSASFQLVTALQPAFHSRPTGPNEWYKSFVSTTVIQSGSWHNYAPGEIRFVLDYTRLVNLFDHITFPSLVTFRSTQERWEHRVKGLSEQDVETLKDTLRKNAVTPTKRRGPEIDWRATIRVLLDRYTERLELMRDLLETFSDSTSDDGVVEIGRKVQSVLRIMLHTYIPLNCTTLSEPFTQVNAHQLYADAAQVFERCSKTNFAHLLHGSDRYTDSERLILRAILQTNKEICRVVVNAWVGGIPHGLDPVAGPEEPAPGEELRKLIAGWQTEIGGLMNWLDWSVWHKCKPACGVEEMCYLPTWPYLGAPLPTPPPTPKHLTDEINLNLYLKRNAFIQTATGQLQERGNETVDWLDPQPSCIRRVWPYHTFHLWI